MPVDINRWQLQLAGDVTFEFGTLATDYPFAVQAEIGPVDWTIEDQRHPTSDGELMGRDLLGGFNITFSVTTVPDPKDANKMIGALDLASFFRAKWLNTSSRRIPGEYVTLTNKLRGRVAYGRPRRCAPVHTRMRRGQIGLVADFRSNNPYFYSEQEYAEVFSIIPGAITGFVAPVTAPITLGVSTHTDGFVDNNGDVPTWPIIHFQGPGSDMSFELLDSGWTLGVRGQIAADEILKVDTRPWARGATLNGNPANGRITGTQLEKCTIPAGNREGRFRAWDPTGTAQATVYWRDAFASL